MTDIRDDGLITCIYERNPNLLPKRKRRRKPIKKMKGLTEIGDDYKPNRDFLDKPNEIGRCKKKRVMPIYLHSQVEILSSDMERAQEVQANLNTRCPSFVKPMIRSNVMAGFWLSLPKLFCDWHLPNCDSKVTLVDESHREYYTKYLAERRGLSAGWKGFSVAHKLNEGDVLVFHLVGFCKMKVYIVRANHFCAVDAALSLLQLQAHAKLVGDFHEVKRSFRGRINKICHSIF